ncbi:stage II sporulation protein SB [Bacillus mycoides]|uniref:Stage II sporulation protein SB n=1 Tax=Bacillus thuringiensis serovar navarrensis TaxID=339658 RepID=A0A243ARE0_BACTU|nr:MULTISPECIES: stage II sporulation protein SB [Bacillus cereus group]MED1270334.1 stage II sporulation protein SB [Bacillus mycoides]OTY29886.1 stage II sporulation protein SB [Bacillus thuringiensis serovar navarrensis]
MAEVNAQKSSFFKTKKEESNTDFSLVKGALTQDVNRLEKFMEDTPYKYIKEDNLKENA